MITDRIARFLRDPESDSFAALALDAWAFQVEHSAILRAFGQRRARLPEQIDDWRQIPAVPATAYKAIDLALEIPQAREAIVFKSSGTTAGEGRRSHHRHPFPALYRDTINRSFPDACLPPTCGLRVPILSLVPPFARAPESSLAFMIDHVTRRWGDESTTWAMTTDGFDATIANTWAGERSEQGRPSLIVATAFALAYWLDALREADATLKLPPGTVVFETGGFKGRHRQLSRAELVAEIGQRLGVDHQSIVREYGMTELTSQFYTRALDGGDPDLFVAQPWTRARMLDPFTLDEVADGETGLVSIFDLANVGSALHLLTEDLGIAEAGGFRLVGRARGAELRGCSLATEELA